MFIVFVFFVGNSTSPPGPAPTPTPEEEAEEEEKEAEKNENSVEENLANKIFGYCENNSCEMLETICTTTLQNTNF